jgi:hypothetical protein
MTWDSPLPDLGYFKDNFPKREEKISGCFLIWESAIIPK